MLSLVGGVESNTVRSKRRRLSVGLLLGDLLVIRAVAAWAYVGSDDPLFYFFLLFLLSDTPTMFYPSLFCPRFRVLSTNL
jgi:hypothetical protein